MKKIHQLELRYCSVGDLTLEYIAEHCRDTIQLTTLDGAYITNLTPLFVCSRLLVLNIQSCSAIGRYQQLEFRNALPHAWLGISSDITIENRKSEVLEHI